jgi:hypothetical protein
VCSGRVEGLSAGCGSGGQREGSDFHGEWGGSALELPNWQTWQTYQPWPTVIFIFTQNITLKYHKSEIIRNKDQIANIYYPHLSLINPFPVS